MWDTGITISTLLALHSPVYIHTYIYEIMNTEDENDISWKSVQLISYPKDKFQT